MMTEKVKNYISNIMVVKKCDFCGKTTGGFRLTRYATYCKKCWDGFSKKIPSLTKEYQVINDD